MSLDFNFHVYHKRNNRHNECNGKYTCGAVTVFHGIRVDILVAIAGLAGPWGPVTALGVPEKAVSAQFAPGAGVAVGTLNAHHTFVREGQACTPGRARAWLTVLRNQSHLSDI